MTPTKGRRMGNYALSCESTADLTAEKMTELGIEYICFHFYLDDVEYPDDLGQSVPFDRFYQMMADGVDTRTAAIGSGEYVSHFRKILERGDDILHVSLSSGLSSTVESARIAATQLAPEYPERQIRVVDSLGASSGYGLIMATLSEMRASGTTIDEACEWIEKNKLKLNHWFFSSDLTFYVKGGRVKPAAGFVGNLLGICPLLNMDVRGKLIPREKIRTKKKVIKAIVQKMREHARDGLAYDGRVFISQSACMDDARSVADAIEAEFTQMTGKVEFFSVGTTIGSHTGPGTVALFFWGDERME